MSKIYASNSRLKTSLGKLTTSGLFYFKMGRTIKFRVWNESEKKYFIPFFGARLDLGLRYFETHIKCAYPEQFTGFKSINKKSNLEEDIYEGDIFRQTDETDLGDEVTYHVVMWLNERGAFYMIPVAHYYVIIANGIPKKKEFNWLLDDACLYDFSFDVKLTKVGNIHENPELLNT